MHVVSTLAAVVSIQFTEIRNTKKEEKENQKNIPGRSEIVRTRGCPSEFHERGVFKFILAFLHVRCGCGRISLE